MAKTAGMELVIYKIKDEYPELTKEKIEGILRIYCKAVMENFYEMANDWLLQYQQAQKTKMNT